jgi:hypothetical protein
MSMQVFVSIKESTMTNATLHVMGRVLNEKAGIHLSETGEESADIILRLDSRLPREGYAIEDQARGICVTGGDERGLFYGVGRWLRGLIFSSNGFRHGLWRGQSAPETSARGIYFATHFWNYYDEAPMTEIETYLEDLALWGCNGLKVWFDMHHFNGMADPRAQEKIARLRHFLKHAAGIGMDTWLGGLANEAYNNSPKHLRADWTCGHDGYEKELLGHYHRELCPNQPGALKQLMEWRGEVFDAFADIGIRYVSMGSYDQGGCTCTACAPWGTNGLLKTGQAYAALAREKLPGCEVVMSTWRFDAFIKGEWQGLHRAFAQRPEWLDAISIDLAHLDHVIPNAPGGLPVFCMPEISMRKMLPWGGYGANPFPGCIQHNWARAARHIYGAYPYSEGIYEDLNKIVALQLQWDSRRAAADIVNEYARFYFGGEAAADVCRAVEILETNLSHCAYIVQDGKMFNTYLGQLRNVNCAKPWTLEHHVGPPLVQAEECRDLLERAAGKMADSTRQSWRWRILFLRARIDAELAAGHGDNDTVKNCCMELTRIYHADNCKLPCMVPPTMAAYTRLLENPIEVWL